MQAEQKQGMGPEGFCVCLNCRVKIQHRDGIPCRKEKCSNCGAKMVREGSYHHLLIEEKRKEGNGVKTLLLLCM